MWTHALKMRMSKLSHCNVKKTPDCLDNRFCGALQLSGLQPSSQHELPTLHLLLGHCS